MNKLKAMQEGGSILGEVRQKLFEFTQVGVSPQSVEREARRLIKKAGAETSFTKVPGYKWATCVNINSGIVHGIPESTDGFKDGDMVTVDVGVYYHGYHTDAAFTKVVGKTSKRKERFIEGGLKALQKSIEAAVPGNRIGDISHATQKVLKDYGYHATHELTGHGVGRELHEEPLIPNLLKGKIEKTPQLVVGQTLAIEIIYAEETPHLYLEEDGWTISVKGDKLSAVLEETVQIREDGYSVLTNPTLFQMYPSGTIST